MEEKIARLISILFHPLLIPTYAMLILINIPTYHVMVLPPEHRYLSLLFVFLMSFVLPVICMLILLKLGVVKSLEMKTQHERIIPLIIVSAFFYLTYYLLKQGPHYSLFNIFMLGATLLVIISLLVNYLTKISIHMVAMGGLFGTFTGFSLVFHLEYEMLLYGILFIAGITGFARLKLKAHSQAQVYAGFGLGSLVMIGLFIFI